MFNVRTKFVKTSFHLNYSLSFKLSNIFYIFFCCHKYPLRGIKDSPPYLHDGRLLTLDDTVEFFNIVLELHLKKEKKDLVAFMQAQMKSAHLLRSNVKSHVIKESMWPNWQSD